VLWSERGTSLLVRVILLEKLLGSSVAQTLVMVICEAVSLQRILGCKTVVKLGKCKKMTAEPPVFSSASHKGQEKYSNVIVSAGMRPEHMHTLLGTE